MTRIIIIGNSGSGKTTLARRLAEEKGIPLLAMDDIAWNPGPERKPLDETLNQVEAFTQTRPDWIIEGCYGDIAEALLPRCDALYFLNPGVETCVARCLSRPWEPDKFATPQEQDEKLAFLVDWVKDYPTRQDEFGLAMHRRIFDSFNGEKHEYTA